MVDFGLKEENPQSRCDSGRKGVRRPPLESWLFLGAGTWKEQCRHTVLSSEKNLQLWGLSSWQGRSRKLMFYSFAEWLLYLFEEKHITQSSPPLFSLNKVYISPHGSVFKSQKWEQECTHHRKRLRVGLLRQQRTWRNSIPARILPSGVWGEFPYLCRMRDCI